MAKKPLSEFELDCLWMSTRYCIGRHTIASCSHASEIAKNCYERMNENDRIRLSQIINREIDSMLSVSGWYDARYVFVNRPEMKPLCVLYFALSKIGVTSIDTVRKIQSIELAFNQDTNMVEHTVHMKSRSLADRLDTRSFMDLNDLEAWQNLSILLDPSEHKWCRLVNGQVAEYYETWTTYRNYENGRTEIKKIKVLVEFPYNLEVRKVITEENIEEDEITEFETYENKRIIKHNLNDKKGKH